MEEEVVTRCLLITLTPYLDLHGQISISEGILV
jgi:hypothetical protein